MNTAIAIVLCIIIGFVGEWIFDFFYLRRKTNKLEDNIADLEHELTATEGQLDIMAAENQRITRGPSVHRCLSAAIQKVPVARPAMKKAMMRASCR